MSDKLSKEKPPVKPEEKPPVNPEEKPPVKPSPSSLDVVNNPPKNTGRIKSLETKVSTLEDLISQQGETIKSYENKIGLLHQSETGKNLWEQVEDLAKDMFGESESD